MPLTTGISFGNFLSLAQRETLAHQTSSQGFSLELKGGYGGLPVFKGKAPKNEFVCPTSTYHK